MIYKALKIYSIYQHLFTGKGVDDNTRPLFWPDFKGAV